MKLTDIAKDSDIYPRVQFSHKTVETYTEALKAGAKFPPVLVQRIREGEQVKTIILDGLHRLEAYKEAQIDDIEVQYWKDQVLDKKAHLEELRLQADRCNLAHGDRLKENDLKFQLLRIVNDRSISGLVGIIKFLAQEHGKTEGYISQLVGAEVNRRKQSRDALAYRLHLLGWTYEEIAKHVGLSGKSAVAERFRNFDTKLFEHQYRNGIPPEKIASFFNLDEALVWAILLEEKDDIERFKLFGNKDYGTNEEGDPQPRLSDYWVFTNEDPRLGQSSYEGHLFGQQIMNIIYHYSRQGDLVVDPMAGGGVTIDACLVMNRKCRAYDIDPTKSERKDIGQHDAREELPQKARGCDLIILDPPYYKKEEEEYECEEFIESRDKFIENIGKVAQSCFSALKKGGYLAFIFGQYIDYENEDGSVLDSHIWKKFKEVGFRGILEIQVPLPLHTRWDDYDIERAKQHQPWRILPVSRNWYILKKTTNSEGG